MNSLLLVTRNYAAVKLLSSANASNGNENQCFKLCAFSSYDHLIKMKNSNHNGSRFCCKNSREHHDGRDAPLKIKEVFEDSKVSDDMTLSSSLVKYGNIDNKESIGIGIVKFLRGKSYFISGGTGFLGNAIIEKILRASPEVGKIYVLVKATNKEAAFTRMKKEIIEDALFDVLRHQRGNSYESFMLSKLVAVPGNVGESNLGINDDPSLLDEITNNVEIIINSAANTTFDERFDVAVNINTKGPERVMNFAKKCNQLCAFIHLSTAFVNQEKRVGNDSKETSHLFKEIDTEIKLALDSTDLPFHHHERARNMKILGLQRAKMYGWTNVYEFTKAMGEMVVEKNREEIPTVILRPSIVEGTYKNPYPGWIQGNRMFDPVILLYGKGYLPVLSFDPKAILDIVPLDMVVNATITAMAKHGIAKKPELNIYNVVSSGVNPLTIGDLMNFLYEHFNSSPLINMSNGKTIDIARIQFLRPTTEDMFSYISEAVMKQNPDGYSKMSSQRFERKCRKILELITHLINLYEPYCCRISRFEFEETNRLRELMSEGESQIFPLDFENIDWKEFFVNIHIPGLRKYTLKGRGTRRPN